MSNLSVKNRVKLINSKFVGSTKGFNNLPRYQPQNENNNTWNVNNVEIPENFYVSPPNSPTGLNSPISVASNVGSVASVAPSPDTLIEEDPVNIYVPPPQHNYAANIASWKSRNTSKNKKYKTRSNYNANNRAQLRAQLAEIKPSLLGYSNAGEEHSTQYWQNKRLANAAVKVKPVEKAPSKWAPVPTGKLVRTRKNRRNGRKSRKNRNGRK